MGWMGQAGTACQNSRWAPSGKERSKFSDKIQDETWEGTGQSLFFPIISYFRASFPVLEHTFPVLERHFLFYNVFSCFRTSFSCLECPFPVFLFLLGKWFCPMTFRDREVCPRIFAPALVLGNIFVLGQWDVPSWIVHGRLALQHMLLWLVG